MKEGLTVQQLATRINQELPLKRDFIAPTTLLRMTDDGYLRLQGANGPRRFEREGVVASEFSLSDLALGQIGDRVNIPDKYLKRMREEAPTLLATNVNHWFQANPEKRMVRTVGDSARAFLSERYRPIDNIDIAVNLLPKVLKAGCEVKSSQITEKRLYIQAICPNVQVDIARARGGHHPVDIVQAGLVISNSEVGCGSVKIEPMIYRLVCTNGLIVPAMAMKKFHIGRGGFGDGDAVSEYLSDETRKLDDKAFWAKVNDIAGAMLEQGSFEKVVQTFKATQDRQLVAEPARIVELAQEAHGTNEDETQAILRHLCEGGDFTQFGLANAVTRTAQDVESYDRCIELERLGGEIMELTNAAYLN